MSRNHYRMISKCIRYMEWKASGVLEFGGYLTPVEALSLNEMAGVTCTEEWSIPYLEREKSEGNCKPTWCYFVSTNRALNESIIERKKKLTSTL